MDNSIVRPKQQNVHEHHYTYTSSKHIIQYTNSHSISKGTVETELRRGSALEQTLTQRPMSNKRWRC